MEEIKDKFQYISCCSLSSTNFQHLCQFILFQYISCCSLSIVFPRVCKEVKKFQYISCCSLSISLLLLFLVGFCFNTSHVVVYLDYIVNNNFYLEFQYISCCSLSQLLLSFKRVQQVSIHLMLQFIFFLPAKRNRNRCFNTSHVVVYQSPAMFKIKFNEFQYISCCSLSILCVHCHFIYSRFNTSHVVVYLTELINISMFHSRFNTSHVVVYQDVSFEVDLSHLFQYISCCSLSPGRCRGDGCAIVSIHLMLQFIFSLLYTYSII